MQLSHQLSIVLLLVAPAAAQGSDDCANAQSISGMASFVVDTSSATTDGPANACGQSNQIHNDVWFVWTAASSGSVEINTCAAGNFDTTIAVYAAAGCPVGATLACNDDDCALLSRTTFTAITGSAYLIRVGGWSSANRGQTTLTVGSGAGLPNDTCAAPTPIAGYATFAADTTFALTDGVADGCGQGGQIHRDVWFAWAAPVTEAVEVNTCGASFDTTVAIYDGTSCPTAVPIACNDDACATQTRVAFAATAGAQYLIRMGGYNDVARGALTFSISDSTIISCNSPPVGPDVIVGDLPNVLNYGGVGGVGAYALATTACNVGDSTMPWTGANAHHPVIGQNLYRIENGSIQQLGMSWVKHGFASATGNYCCTCINPGSNQIMGIGCSDPYGAGTNGNQNGLGLRSEVDPWTGIFVYPFTTQGQSGNTIFKRLQVANTEMDPALHAGASYVVEGQYVTPDDAVAGNQNNNCSWAPVAVGGFTSGAFQISIAGSTSVGEPAVYAWQAADPAVRIEQVSAPNDGLFHVASRAHDNGDGTWRYEYAVHNENAARSGASLRVPIAIGANISAVTFHDVNYHSGEVWDGTDWAPRIAMDAVSWSTTPYVVSPNANALRWGSLYSFSFTADVGPSPGDATLGLFTPGATDTLTVGAVVPGGAALAVRYCDPAVLNSTGLPAEMYATGSPQVIDNDLTLIAIQLPPVTVGYMIGSQTEGFVVQPGGSEGNLCLGGTIARFRAQIQNSGIAGRFHVPIDLTAIPLGPGQAVMPGETWSFQAWFRDMTPSGSAGSNFTDGIRVTFE